MGASCRRTIRRETVAIMTLVLYVDEKSPAVRSKNSWNARTVSSTSLMIPKTNMRVVIPNMIILGRDEVKLGLLLKATVLSACAVLHSET